MFACCGRHNTSDGDLGVAACMGCYFVYTPPPLCAQCRAQCSEPSTRHSTMLYSVSALQSTSIADTRRATHAHATNQPTYRASMPLHCSRTQVICTHPPHTRLQLLYKQNSSHAPNAAAQTVKSLSQHCIDVAVAVRQRNASNETAINGSPIRP